MRKQPKQSLARFFLISLLILPNIAYGLEQPGDDLLDYTIEVSFDIPASKIKGVATIPLKKGQEISLDKGDLNLLYVILDKDYPDITVQERILRILSPREGVLGIGFEGMFKELPLEFPGERISSAIYKQIDQSTLGITEEILKEPVAVEIPTLKTLPDVIARVAGKKIIYVGETHNLFPDHVMELEIIKDLHKRGRPVAIGMEMFQRPFQRVLDDYVGGKIDEAEFLKGTEYFKRWGFDYNLYRPILLYARSENIPVIALNISQEIVDKVFRSGLDSLSEEGRKSIPSQMDFSDEAYKERLKKVFLEHRDVENFKTSNFDFFYQAQILWDETMAESVDQFLKTPPHDQMVVLAGSGHLAYGSGIPKRTARRNGFDYAIILNNADLEKGIADFVLFPGAIPGGTSPMLMVFLREEVGKVEIAGFPQESASEKAGMKVGDIILAIDHTPIRTIDDVKIDLLAREKGERVRVRVLRKGFLGSREINFDVILQ
jgi:uncharacterized iron-regulated protein